MGTIFVVAKTTVSRWFDQSMSLLYQTHPFNVRNRRLHLRPEDPLLPNPWKEWCDICIHATMTNPCVSEIYRPWLEAYQQRNPNAPRLMYTVVLALDGVEIEVPKSRDPHLQARTYSSKSSINALGKLVFLRWMALPDSWPSVQPHHPLLPPMNAIMLI